MTPDADARLAEIRARSEAALPFDLATHAFQDVPWLLDRLAAETERADKAAEFGDSLVESTCPNGKHGSWFCECEYAHTCGWCERDAARAELAELRARIEALCDEIDGDVMKARVATTDEIRAALSPAEETN